MYLPQCISHYVFEISYASTFLLFLWGCLHALVFHDVFLFREYGDIRKSFCLKGCIEALIFLGVFVFPQPTFHATGGMLLGLMCFLWDTCFFNPIPQPWGQNCSETCLVPVISTAEEIPFH